MIASQGIPLHLTFTLFDCIPQDIIRLHQISHHSYFIAQKCKVIASHWTSPLLYFMSSDIILCDITVTILDTTVIHSTLQLLNFILFHDAIPYITKLLLQYTWSDIIAPYYYSTVICPAPPYHHTKSWNTITFHATAPSHHTIK